MARRDGKVKQTEVVQETLEESFWGAKTVFIRIEEFGFKYANALRWFEKWCSFHDNFILELDGCSGPIQTPIDMERGYRTDIRYRNTGIIIILEYLGMPDKLVRQLQTLRLTLVKKWPKAKISIWGGINIRLVE